MALRDFLLGSLAPASAYRSAPPEPMTTTSTVACLPNVNASTMLADCEAIMRELRPRRGVEGGSLDRMTVVADPTLTPGLFSLSEPGQAPYAVALPMAALSALYQWGDVLHLSPEAIAQIPTPAPIDTGAVEIRK